MTRKSKFNLEAHEKELRHFERALSAERGIKIEVESKDAAVNLRMRLNRYRAEVRRQNQILFPPDHPRHANTPFDSLIISIDGNDEKGYVILRKRGKEEVEEL